MKKLFLLALLALTFCLPSAGQIREIYDDGYVDVSYGGGIYARLADAMYSYRLIYDRYPETKREILDILLQISEEERAFYIPPRDCVSVKDPIVADQKPVELDSSEDVIDLFAMVDQTDHVEKLLNYRDSVLTVDLNNPENTLVVSGDTCTFTYAQATREVTFYGINDSIPPIVRRLKMVQCIGGAEELQKTESVEFRRSIRSRFFDLDGKCLFPMTTSSPFMPAEVTRPFRYFAIMESRTAGEPEFPMFGHIRFPLVFVPVTMTRSGDFSIDTSCLDGIQLYYRERTSNPDSVIGTITLEDAMDQDRIDAMKAYLTDFLAKHKEVYTIKLWEVLCFNLKENDDARD